MTKTFLLPAEGELFLGSSRTNDVVVTVPGVSRRHAKLCPAPGALRLIDLDSRNGLIYEGERRRQVLLPPGRSVRIGRAEVSLEDVASSDAEIALPLDGASSEVLAGSRPTDVLEVRRRSAETALDVVRRNLGSPIGGEARRRLLEEARWLLGARSLARFGTPPSDGDPGLAIEDLSGPPPSEELCRELAAFEPSPDPRWHRLAGGGACLASRPATPSEASLVAALFDPLGSKVLEPPGWAVDFFAWLAWRWREDPRSGAAAAPAAPPPPGELDPPPGMVLGESPAMTRLLEEIRESLGSSSDVLLEGETGTGKELFAKLLHRSRATSGGPFLAINCAAIPGQLLEALLFGIARRIATDVDPGPGLFQQARGGTLLLDEIAELPLPLQTKLLRVLEEREVLPLGAARPTKIDARVIATSGCDLWRRVREGRFRKDLFFRLAELRFALPPLRESREDVALHAGAFARAALEGSGKRIRGISRRALSELEAHAWPGNLRELRLVIRKAVLRCRHGESLESRHFRDLLLEDGGTGEPVAAPETPAAETPVAETPVAETPASGAPLRPLKEQLEPIEKRAILAALNATGGNRTRAAGLLGVSRQGLLGKLRRLGLDAKPPREAP